MHLFKPIVTLLVEHQHRASFVFHNCCVESITYCHSLSHSVMQIEPLMEICKSGKKHRERSEDACAISLCPVLRKRAEMRGMMFMGLELVFWLGFVLYAFLTSLFFSLLLFPRFLASYFQHGGNEEEDDGSVVFYEGTVYHRREKPVRHCFSLAVRYALLDLDRMPTCLASGILKRHMTAKEARRIAGTSGRVFLLTIPTSVGYDYDPVAVYYCYDSQSCEGEQLKRCIVEVSNTPWTERVTFAFSPGSDFVIKTLHVSPFNDTLGNWSLHTGSPGEKLFLKIALHHPTLGNGHIVATLQGRRVSPSVFWRHNPDMYFWLMPHKAAIWTYWQAFNLWWKGVPFVQHPRYSNPNYIKEKFNGQPTNLGNCKKGEQDLSLCTEPDESSVHDQMESNNQEKRNFSWRSAEWPWSYDF